MLSKLQCLHGRGSVALTRSNTCGRADMNPRFRPLEDGTERHGTVADTEFVAAEVDELEAPADAAQPARREVLHARALVEHPRRRAARAVLQESNDAC